jgi:hypothetical protein
MWVKVSEDNHMLVCDGDKYPSEFFAFENAFVAKEVTKCDLVKTRLKPF